MKMAFQGHLSWCTKQMGQRGTKGRGCHNQHVITEHLPWLRTEGGRETFQRNSA